MAIINGDDKNNTLNGTSVADAINGLGGDDTLRGLAGNDILDGGLGNDDMAGGTGNDIYYITYYDRVTELAGAGTDEIRTSETYTLPANVENLTLTGVWSQSGRGNALNNVILGNNGNDLWSGNNWLYGLDGNDTLRGLGGNDVLDGGFGNDLMVGGAGNDIYFVGRTGDRVVELGREGTDEVRSYLHNYSLGANVENLTFVGAGTFNGTGNALNNVIIGGNGTNTFIGGSGNDTLRGGLGNDTAIFAGRSTDYTITTVNGVTTVVDNNPVLNGNDGRDTLIGVEHFRFLDRTISQHAITPVVSLASFDGATGFRLVGTDAGDLSGRSVSSAGDVNGDGFDDVIVGAAYAESAGGASNEGGSYVVFGKASWTGTPSIDLATLDGISGFSLIGIDADDVSGHAVSSAGDVNGDGFADVIVGAPKAEGAGGANWEGESYVVFGKASWAGTPSLDLATLNGTNGFRLSGIELFESSGTSVSSAGDVNGDGFDDLIVGAPPYAFDPYEYGASSRSYVVFGKASWAGTPSLDLATLDGSNGFRLAGVSSYDFSGVSVSSAGDVNGDGFDDVIVGASANNGEFFGVGTSYVVFGKASWTGTPSLDLAALDGTNGFRLIGTYGGAAGRSVSSAGDVNGDGYGDVIIGAPLADGTNAAYYGGESYVVFGKASWAGTPSLDLTMLNGSNGFRLSGADGYDISGASVSSAGDINGDGFDDVIVGAPRAEGGDGRDPSEGESYVVYGRASWAGTPSFDVSTLDGTNGFRLRGGDVSDYSGASVSSAGDVNGDGFDDLMIGAPSATTPYGTAGGASYVVFGGNFTGSVTHLGTAGNNTLNGTAAAENFVGGLGNDIFNGGGGADSFQGGDGNDTARLTGTSFFHIDGGHGVDSIALASSGLTFDLTTILPERIESIERIDITGSGNNTLRLSVRDVLDLSDESNSLLVAGNAGDTVIRGAGWTEATSGGNNGDGTSTIGGQVYQHYNAGLANLLVDTDISVLTS